MNLILCTGISENPDIIKDHRRLLDVYKWLPAGVDKELAFNLFMGKKIMNKYNLELPDVVANLNTIAMGEKNLLEQIIEKDNKPGSDELEGNCVNYLIRRAVLSEHQTLGDYECVELCRGGRYKSWCQAYQKWNGDPRIENLE